MKTVFTLVILNVFLGALDLGSASECKENCSTGFSCTGIQNCTCLKYSGQYELLCSTKGENYVLSSTVRPNSYLHILCTPGTTESDLNLLKNLRVGPVDDVSFRLCPVPDASVPELLSTFGVTSVSTFHFQSHRDVSGTFNSKQLMGLENVTKLLLMSNNLTDLPEDFLGGLSKLTWLDLRENNLRLPKKFFDPVPNLEVLELGDNKLTQLDPPLLSNLRSLRLLNLWKNNLRNIGRGIFSGLSSLEQLDISSNSIVTLPSDVFHDLVNLRKLSIYSNNFTNLPKNLLSENKNLEVFRLHDNRQALTLSDGIFSSLSKLREVYLMRNNITFVPEDIFWRSSAVTNISLQGNALTELPSLLFRDQKNLQVLDISENNLQAVPDNIFGRLENLQILKLGWNKIKTITREVFYGLSNLVSLDMEHNELHFIDSESLTHLITLRTARFSHNSLSFLPDESQTSPGFLYLDPFGTVSPFRNCLSLEFLYLSNNSITEIFYDWRITLITLRTLDLSHNLIQGLSTSDVQFLQENLSVDLRHNKISVVNLQHLESLALSQNLGQLYSKKNVRLLLEGIPLNCDCRAYELLRYFEQKLDPAVYGFVTLVPGNLRCNFPESLKGVKVEEIKSRDLTCYLNRTYDCPDDCDCVLRRHDWALIVNCTGLGLTDIPSALPRIGTTNHTELLLDNNRIGVLPNSTYPGYEEVTHLHLSSNNITYIDTGILSKSLQVLTLDENNLTTLSSNMVRFLSESDGIRHLTLHNNPWKCDCSAREFLDLIQQKFKEIPHLGNVTCLESGKPLSKLSVSDLCPMSIAVIVSCILAATFGLLVGSLAAFYYRYQREVKVWLYSHRFCLWFVTEEELDRDKLYDAFVSYSHKDENFVVNTLVPELESGENPFKLCLHYRDWVAGEWIPNQIAKSVENSKRTLVILSPNFLESVWSRMEFRAAHKQALCEGRARVIVVLYGDVGPTEDLDPELRAYISMNTYVKWGDPWFWGKLKYALPHPPSLVRTNFDFMRRRSIKLEKSHIDDKLELIHTPDPSSLPPGGTTPPLDEVSTENAVHGKSVPRLA